MPVREWLHAEHAATSTVHVRLRVCLCACVCVCLAADSSRWPLSLPQDYAKHHHVSLEKMREIVAKEAMHIEESGALSYSARAALRDQKEYQRERDNAAKNHIERQIEQVR